MCIRDSDYGYHYQNWSIAEDGRGMIYIANNDGILEFDGSTWRLIRLTDDDICMSIASDSAGRLYAGGAQHIGYLAPNDSGRLAFRSITHLLPDSLRDFSYIWSIQIIDGLVYYQSSKQIMRWNPRTKTLKVIGPGNYQVGLRYGNSYLIRERGVGLMRLEGDELKLVRGGEQYADQPLVAMVPLESGKYVLAKSDGLILYDGVNFSNFPTEADPYFSQHQPYAACTIDTGLIAVATLNGGVVILDAQGRWRQTFGKSTGLLTNDMTMVYKPRSGGLWVTTIYGVAWVDYPSPLTLSIRYDLQAQSIIRRNGELLLGCVQGIYKLIPSQRMAATVEPLPGSSTNVWTLFETSQGTLAGSELGLNVVLPNGYREINTEFCYTIAQLSDGKHVVAGGLESIYLLKSTPGGWVCTDTLKIKGNDVWSLIEEPAGTLWVGTRNGFITRFNLRNIRSEKPVFYDSTRGPMIGNALGQDLKFFTSGSDLLLGTSVGLFRYDRTGDRFLPDSRFGDRFTTGQWGIFLIEPDRWWTGRYWLAAYNTKTTEYRIYRATRNSSGSFEVETTRLSLIGRVKVTALYSEPDGVLWVGTDKGLIRYDQKFEVGFAQPFPTVLRSIRAGNKPIFTGTLFGPDSTAVVANPEQPPLRIGYRDNTVRFEFASLFYVQPSLTEYQHRLVGFEEEWSAWTRELFKEYTNLPEGTYTFEVRARNVYGIIGSTASQELIVFPPWYRTWWAYTLFFLAFSGLIYGVFRWRLRALAEANRLLEQKVEERTAEVVRQSQQLEQQNQEIVRQKEEIEHQNQEITDSIKYASRIQEAILPSRVAIAQAFPQSFVLYKPKDIVSGDFYWFAEESGWRLIAAVDCTGHGIPGAFMSVLGSSLLNQIVSEKHITDPGTILNRLNELVRENLHQVDAKSESKDGMDLMLLAFPSEADRVLYSGANNPLYLIRGGELTEFKAHKYPIGGGQYEDRHFETSELPLEDGDVLYIFSDGYADQFGGPNRRKFMYGKFKKFLVEIHKRSMAEQRDILDQTIDAWRAESQVEQIDDILVIGLRPRG
jgi:serine phosphatase RsbU (regulator of sigma subunit)/ligand-binding sensor domain-containing protein